MIPVSTSFPLRDSPPHRKRARIAPLRYPISGGKTPREKRSSRIVLVPLTAGIDEALELALKSILALSGVPGIRLILKPHPSILSDVLLSNLPELPLSVEVSSVPVNRLLDRADLVLYNATTVAVEALGRGIPLIHVKSDLAIDRNILEGFPMVPSAGDPQEIRTLATSPLEKGGPPLEEARKAALEIFTPLGKGSVDLMLGVRNEPFPPSSPGPGIKP